MKRVQMAPTHKNAVLFVMFLSVKYCECFNPDQFNPTRYPTPSPTITPLPTSTQRPSNAPTTTHHPTPKPTMFPTIKAAESKNPSYRRYLKSILAPLIAGICGVLVASWIFIRDRYRKKAHDKYLEELEVERSAYREELRKERETKAGMFYGTTHHTLTPKEEAQLELDVNAEYPDEMFQETEYANLVAGILIVMENVMAFLYDRLCWRPYFQGNYEPDYMFRHHQKAIGYAKSQLSMNSMSDLSTLDEDPSSSTQSMTLSKRSIKEQWSIKEGLSPSSPSPPQRTGAHNVPSYSNLNHPLNRSGHSHQEFMKHHSSQHALRKKHSLRMDNDEESHKSSFHENNALPSKVAMSGHITTLGSENDNSNSILGFPKDCGPRAGVRILSYQRAMHVRNLNHPHLTFERAGVGVDAWYCITDGFYDTKITDCIEEHRLPTFEQETKKTARASARRRRELTKKSKMEEAEIAATLLREFPPFTPEDPVRYIVSFPLDYDLGMHGCVYYEDSCGYGEVQKLLGCIDDKPLEEPLAPYGVGLMLYFKFQKVMINFFAAWSVVAAVTIYFNYRGSGYTTTYKNDILSQQQNWFTYGIFFTSLGSWGEKTVQCHSEDEGGNIDIQCSTGVVTSIEAYYGQPTGSCSCPSAQQMVDDNAGGLKCPDRVRYEKNNNYGTCNNVPSWVNGTLTVEEEYCLQGTTAFGAACCASDHLGSPNYLPDFTDLLPARTPGCDSDTAQYIANEECLGQSNCTLVVRNNKTYEWDVRNVKILGKTTRLGCGNSSSASSYCSVKLGSSSSNFTTCDRDSSYPANKGSGLKMMVVATCWSDTVVVNKTEYKKTNVAIFLASADAFMVAVLMYLIYWLKQKESDDVEKQDQQRVTAADFTMRILWLPHEYKDVEIFAKELKKHFEKTVIVKGEKDLDTKKKCEDKPVKVIDINFGFDDQSVLRAKKKRGKIARKLDLAMTKVRLLETHGTDRRTGLSYGLESRLRSAQRDVRSYTVQFKEQTKVLDSAPARKVRTAFVTFETRRQRDACLKLYKDKGRFTSWFQRSSLRFVAKHEVLKKEKSGFTIRGVTAAEPENLIWENLGLDFSERVFRTALSWILTCGFLFCGSALIFYAQQEQEKIAESYPTLDCTPYQVYPFFNESGVTWSNGTRTLNTVGSNVITAQSIVEDLRPEAFNLTDYNTGLLGCFCAALLDSSAVDCKEPQYRDQCGLNGLDYKFEDERGNDHQYCRKWSRQLQTVLYWQYGAVTGIVMINVMLKQILRKLVDLEAPESETRRIVSLTVKLFVALLVNTALITLLIRGNLSELTGGSTFVDSLLRNIQVLQGSHGDFGTDWYLSVGSAIVLTMFLSIFTPQMTKLGYYAMSTFQQFWDRGCRPARVHYITQKAAQHDLEELYLGPQVELEELYASFLNQFFVTLMFNAGMPILTIIFLIYMVVCFSFDKFTFLRLYRLPPALDETAATATTSLLNYAVVFHILISMWMYSNPDIFEADAAITPDEIAGIPVERQESVTSFIQLNYTNFTNCSLALMDSFVMNTLNQDNATCLNNTMGYYQSSTSTYYVNSGSIAAVQLGDALSKVYSFQGADRFVQSQCIVYLPLLFFYMASFFLYSFFQLFPELRDRAQRLQDEKLKQLEEALSAAADDLFEEMDARNKNNSANADGSLGGGNDQDKKDNDKEKKKDDKNKKKKDDKENTDDDGGVIFAAVDSNQPLTDAAVRHRALTAAVEQVESGLLDVKYFTTLSTETLETRLALNQLEVPVLRAYSRELQHRLKQHHGEEFNSGAAVAALSQGNQPVSPTSPKSPNSPSSPTSPSSPGGNLLVGSGDIIMDGLETYNMSGNYKYVNRFGLDSASMLLHKKGKLKVDYKQYIQDVQDLSRSGPIKFIYRLLVGVEFDDPFPEPDLEIERAIRRLNKADEDAFKSTTAEIAKLFDKSNNQRQGRRASDIRSSLSAVAEDAPSITTSTEMDLSPTKKALTQNQSFSDSMRDLASMGAHGVVARQLAVLGISSHKSIFGPMIIINVPIPSDLFEMIPSSTPNHPVDEFKENIRIVSLEVPGLGNVKVALPKGVGAAGIPEIQIAIPAVDINDRHHRHLLSAHDCLECNCFPPASGYGGGPEEGHPCCKATCFKKKKNASDPKEANAINLNQTDRELTHGDSAGGFDNFVGIAMQDMNKNKPDQVDDNGNPLTVHLYEAGVEQMKKESSQEITDINDDDESEEQQETRLRSFSKVMSNTSMKAAEEGVTLSRKKLHAAAYKSHHVMQPQEFITHAPEEVILDARIPVVVKGVGKLMAKWPYGAKAGDELRFHLSGISKHYKGHFPNYSIIRPRLGPDGMAVEADDLSQINSVGWATLCPDIDRMADNGEESLSEDHKKNLKEGAKKNIRHSNQMLSFVMRQLHHSKKKKRKTKLPVLTQDDDDVEGGRRDSVDGAEPEDESDKNYGPSLHFQAECYCPQPVLKSFLEAPLWQTLGSCGGRINGFESLVPHDAVILVQKEKNAAFLGCSIRVPLKTDPDVLLHGQRVFAKVPGAGAGGRGITNFQIFADDTVLVPGVHGRLCATRGFLPWPMHWGASTLKQGLAVNQIVPYLDEIYVDFPAVKATPQHGERQWRFKKAAEMHKRHLQNSALHRTTAENVSIARRRGWVVDMDELKKEEQPPSMHATSGELVDLPNDSTVKPEYDGIGVQQQNFNLKATKQCEYKSGTGKHWLAQDVKVGVPLLGHIQAIFPPQTKAEVTELNFTLPALVDPKTDHLNTYEARKKSRRHAREKKLTAKCGICACTCMRRGICASCCEHDVEEREIAYQVGWVVTVLPQPEGAKEGDQKQPSAVLVLPAMVSLAAFKRSIDARNAAVEALYNATKMRHIHPAVDFGHHQHLKHTGDSDSSDSDDDDSHHAPAPHLGRASHQVDPEPSPKAVAPSSPLSKSKGGKSRGIWFNSGKKKKAKEEAAARAQKKAWNRSQASNLSVIEANSVDNGPEVLAALQAAVKGALKYRDRDREITVGDSRNDEDGDQPEESRLGLLAFAEERIEKLLKKYPHLKKVPSSPSKSPSSSSMSDAKQAKEDGGESKGPEVRSELKDDLAVKTPRGSTLNPVSGAGNFFLDEEPQDGVVKSQPGASAPPEAGWSTPTNLINAFVTPPVDEPIQQADSAATVDESSAAGFASFIYDSTKTAVLGEEESSSSSTSSSSETPSVAGVDLSKISNLPKSAAELEEHHNLSTRQVEDNRKELKTFLNGAKLAKFYPKFIDFGVDSVHDALDPSILSDADLKKEIGLTAVQMRNLRKLGQANAAKAAKAEAKSPKNKNKTTKRQVL
jgi:hypothetical protein